MFVNSVFKVWKKLSKTALSKQFPDLLILLIISYFFNKYLCPTKCSQNSYSY